MSWWKFWAKREKGTERPPDYYEEGIALARQKRYHEALTSFRLALREKPEDPATFEQMAVVYTQIGLTEEAIRMYRRALALRPDSPAAHYGVAFLLLKRGERGAAASHLRTFLDSDRAPGAEAERHVRHARETLERLRAEETREEDRASGDEGRAGESGRDAERDAGTPRHGGDA